MNNDLSQWHSVRPWRPTLSLAVREITSVSATFILSSALRTSADAAAAEQSLAALGLSNDDDGSDGDSNAGPQIVSDVLSKGLSVKVNGTPWQRVLMRIDDDDDEAVIILFGLMPGRQYDVELGIVPSEKTMRSQITTATNNDSGYDPSAKDQASTQSANQTGTSASTSQLEPSHTTSESPSPLPPFSLEDRRLQLTNKLSQLTQEHTNLANTLKSARRDAQKADAALRAEIDALRRASERTAPAELRARQKALALQEAARQALAAAEQVKARVEELEKALPDLVRKRDEAEREWEKVREEADTVRARREEAESREKKRAEAKQAELAGLVAKLEKLNAKKEKLDGENGVLSELEEKLRRLEEERERIEGDPYGYRYEEFMPEEDDEVVTPNRDDSQQLQHGGTHRPHFHGHHQHAHPRKRHTHPSTVKGVPPPISRPEPIQRPQQGSRNVNASSAATLPPGPGVIHLYHANTGSLPSNPRRPVQAPSVAGSTSGASGSSNSPSPSPAHAGASQLSSRAPPFEPRGAATVNVKSELNPGSSPFEPRVGALQTVSPTTSPAGKAEGFKKAPGAGWQ